MKLEWNETTTSPHIHHRVSQVSRAESHSHIAVTTATSSPSFDIPRLRLDAPLSELLSVSVGTGVVVGFSFELPYAETCVSTITAGLTV